MSGISGITYASAPVMSQDDIDAIEPQSPGRQRYRLRGPGNIAIGKTTVTGPQLGAPSQLVWLSAAAAAGFGDLIELAP